MVSINLTTLLRGAFAVSLAPHLSKQAKEGLAPTCGTYRCCMVIPWRTTHLKVPRTMRSTMSLRVSNEAMKFHDSPRSFWGSAMRDTGRTAAGDHRPSRWALLRRSPLFVTWSKGGGGRRWRREYTLRGCIGTLQARPLRGALPEYALTAAMRDPRFPPITQAGPLLLPAPHPTTPTSLAGPVQESTVSSDLMGLPCNDHRW